MESIAHTHCAFCSEANDERLIGCCNDGDCPDNVEVMCGCCAKWDEKNEVWRCPRCACNVDSDSESESECDSESDSDSD